MNPIRPLHAFVLALAIASLTQAATADSTATVPAGEQAAITAERVKGEFMHAWQGYKQFAWGHDDLRPLSKTAHDWYGESLLMTPVDALDTLILMGFNDEAEQARELIATKLSFDKDVYVKTFEVTIRLLGGLLSGYQYTGDKRLLALAEDLGTRLLPAFDAKTGLVYVFVNLRTGKVRGTESNPAESGTLLLEFGTLSKMTGKPEFYTKAKRALVEIYKRRSKLDLVGERIDVVTGKWTNTSTHIGARIDSYYEYLWKCWLLFGDRDCLAMWKTSIPAINKYLADEVDGGLWYGQANMNSGKRTGSEYGALDAFFPALLALSGDVSRAKRLQESSFKMWNAHGIEPEAFDYRKMKVTEPGYPLRPEIVESAFYLFRLTGDPQYQAMGRSLFDDFVKYCRSDDGYAALKDVTSKEQRDDMESFVLAETFKYFYLIFAPPEALNLKTQVFNTEAHPLRRTWAG
jgi:ER degradation enhancer, mannosidase alpha-like 2